jgi:hypothetical protein
MKNGVSNDRVVQCPGHAFSMRITFGIIVGGRERRGLGSPPPLSCAIALGHKYLGMLMHDCSQGRVGVLVSHSSSLPGLWIFIWMRTR